MESSPESPVDVVHRLLQVISRQLPFSEATALLDNNLNAHMDGNKIGSGARSWDRWVRFLHYNADKKMSNLSIEIETIHDNDGMVTVVAHWRGIIAGKAVLSEPGTVVYQVRNGKIINVWTHKKNYVFIYGNHIAKYKIAFYWLIIRMMLWRCPPLNGKAS